MVSPMAVGYRILADSTACCGMQEGVVASIDGNQYSVLSVQKYHNSGVSMKDGEIRDQLP